MAKAVPVKVRLSEDAVNPICLQKSLEILHMCVVMEVIQEGEDSERQKEILLTTMQRKLERRKCNGCFMDDVPERIGGNFYA